MKSIYEISTSYLSILDQLEENGGEITPEMEQQLNITEIEVRQKSEAYVAVVKTLESSTKTIDDEIKRLQARKKTMVKLSTSLKDRLSMALKTFGIDEIKNALFTINFRKSESVIIDDIQALPDICKVVKVEAISKTEIKKMIKSGQDIPGAKIITNSNMQIK